MILVTGGTGLLGSHLLLELLQQGKAVRALKRPNSDVNRVLRVFRYYDSEKADALFANITWENADLLDVLELESHFDGVEEVYHCAAIVSFHPKEAKHMVAFNTQSTANLVNIALHKKVKKFGFVSSVASLGRTKDATTLNEKNIWVASPENSKYAKSKYLSEMEVWRGVEEGLNATIINPSVILGPGFWTAGSSHLFPTIYKGFPYVTKGVNAFVDVRDVAFLFRELMDANCFGERFVVAADNVSFESLFQQIAKAFNITPPTKVPSQWLMEILWRFEYWRSVIFGTYPLITKETARTAQGVYRYSSDKIQKQLNFQFRPLSETIAHCCKWFLIDESKSGN
ncbi:MAG: NAD-dependent epimerase/dehydratase family protein [Schleiferiaceae bacterium]|nr:NAD-dependent epimerase/dehydratase family protein [Schleiferiaceae bacterium]